MPWKSLVFTSVLMSLSAIFAAPQALSLNKGDHYVAMGSSFASGPGISPSAQGLPARCGRSAMNYAQQLARLRGLDLTDVTCSGAQTKHVLNAWRELPAQLDAVRADTALVTVTIGGNDIGYIGGLINASCAALVKRSPIQIGVAPKCRPVQPPTESDYDDLSIQLTTIAQQVRARAPKAVLAFVTYMTVLPPSGVCEAAPITPTQADASRAIASRLAAITAQVAQANGALLIDGAGITRAHHVCAKHPWMQGYAANPDWKTQVPYHPTRDAMTAIAAALDKAL